MVLRDYQPGDALPALTKPPVTKTQLVMYSGASGDFNPIHTVEEYAQSVGLGGVIAHGMLTMAFVGHMLTDAIGLEGRLEQFAIRFRGMVRPGDRITCQGRVTERTETDGQLRLVCQVIAENQHGETAIKGTATIAVH